MLPGLNASAPDFTLIVTGFLWDRDANPTQRGRGDHAHQAPHLDRPAKTPQNRESPDSWCMNGWACEGLIVAFPNARLRPFGAGLLQRPLWRLPAHKLGATEGSGSTSASLSNSLLGRLVTLDIVELFDHVVSSNGADVARQRRRSSERDGEPSFFHLHLQPRCLSLISALRANSTQQSIGGGRPQTQHCHIGCRLSLHC